MGAEADADIEWPIDVQADGRPELVHWLVFQADEERERVAVLFDADAPGGDADQAIGAGSAGQAAAADAKLNILDANVSLSSLRQLDHARAVQGDDHFLGIVLQVLTDNEHRLAVAVAVWVGEGDVGGQGDVARDLFQR
jgi:hypothetical protein